MDEKKEWNKQTNKQKDQANERPDNDGADLLHAIERLKQSAFDIIFDICENEKKSYSSSVLKFSVMLLVTSFRSIHWSISLLPHLLIVYMNLRCRCVMFAIPEASFYAASDAISATSIDVAVCKVCVFIVL